MDIGYWGTPIAVQSTPVSPIDNDSSTFQTIEQMIALARASTSDPMVCGVVAGIMDKLPRDASNVDIVRGIFWWVKNNVAFREDEEAGVSELGWNDPYQELLISPSLLIRMPHPMGDCDDFSMLLAALLICAKIPVSFVAIACDEEEPTRWSHVYCRAFPDGKSIVLDASHGSYPGWETGQVKFRRAEWLIG